MTAMTLEKFSDPLSFIPADDRDIWFRVGAALHHESGGSSEGFNIWSDWARSSEKFDEKNQRTTWHSLKAKSGGISGGTIIELAKQHGWQRELPQSIRPQAPRVPMPGKQPEKPLLWDAVVAQLERDGYKLIEAYSYETPDGVEIGENVRFLPEEGEKTFRWRHFKAGAFYSGKPEGAALPPYAIRNALRNPKARVFDVEGEKDANRLNGVAAEKGSSARMVGISTCPGHEEYAATLLKGRTIYIIPDNDKSGESRATRKLEAYKAAGIDVRIVRLPGLPEKGDLSNWLDTGKTLRDLNHLADEADHAAAAELLVGFTGLMQIERRASDDEYLVDRLLPKEGVGVAYGASTLGKTFVALDLGLAVARGIDFAGQYEVEKGPVVYVALEAPAGVRRRIETYVKEHSVNEGDFYLLEYPIELCDPTSVAGFVEKIGNLQRVLRQKVRLVIIDTLAKAMPGRDDNSAKDISAAIRGLEVIRSATEGAVMVVAHPGKDPTKGLRGSYAAHAGVDFILNIRAVEGSTDLREIFVEKQKDGEDSHVAATYRLAVRKLGVSPKGRDITSCIVEWVEAQRQECTRRLTSAQQAVLIHFGQLQMEKSGQRLLPKTGFPDNAIVWELEDLIDRCVKGGDVSNADSARNQKTAIRDQIAKIKGKGLIGMFDGKVWPIRRAA